MNTETLQELIISFCKTHIEDSYYEFKENYAEPEKIGKYISGLSNAAALASQPYGYLIFGVNDTTHEVTGTNFRPKLTKAEGNEDLIPWLMRMMSPRIDFFVCELTVEKHHVAVIVIPAAKQQPTSFKKVKYIRIDTQTQRLDDYPILERKLWSTLELRRFELEYAEERLSEDQIFTLLDVSAVFYLLDLPVPDTKQLQIERLIEERMVIRTGQKYAITNLGAILFARNLEQFPRVGRKMLRVITYADSDRLHAKKEWVLSEGYALSLQKAINLIEDQLPSNEIIEGILRKDPKMYPTVAIREFLANAVIHQDFWICGTGPMVEIFPKRMEITNPGNLLVAIDRLIDCQPQSRNELLARMMRRMKMCEERGSGVDRAITLIENYQLPAPDFEEGQNFFRVTMFAYQTLGEMGQQDKVRACYQHSCLCYVKREYMTNTTLRDRMGIEERNYPLASRILKQTLDKGKIKIQDPDGDGRSARSRKYIPYWG